MIKKKFFDTGLNVLPEKLKKSVLPFLSEETTTPLILYSSEQIRYNLEFFLEHFRLQPQQIFFPVKVCHDRNILSFLDGLNVGFEIASTGELNLLKTLNISSERIIFSNPVKIPGHIKSAGDYGIKTFAVDCEQEVLKIIKNTEHSEVYLKITVANTGAEWRLCGKFGVEKKHVLKLAKNIVKKGISISGLAFHVGWNNTNPACFLLALDEAYEIMQMLRKEHIHLKFLNIGGGFPSHLVDQYEMLKKISKATEEKISKICETFEVKILAEPGSFIVANTAVMICSVIDVIKRKNKNWIFVDSGVFQGFQWIMGGLKYYVIYPYEKHSLKTLKYTVTGPTADSHDVFIEDAQFPEGIKPGDKILIYPAGAYVNSARAYNGFEYPQTYLHV